MRERLEQLGWGVAVMETIPDVISEISERLATLSDGGQVAAIFTTGGTGVAPRDVTPEATRADYGPRNPRFWRVNAPAGPVERRPSPCSPVPWPEPAVRF